MGRVCTICSHKHRRDIDRALVASEPYRRIATRFAVSSASLRRHEIAGHISEKISNAAGVDQVVEAGSLLDQVMALRDRSLSLLDQAEVAGDLRTALAGIREARSCIELLAEVEGKLDRRNVVNITMSSDWIEIRTVLLDALGPYPEASKAVASGLATIDGGPDGN